MPYYPPPAKVKQARRTSGNITPLPSQLVWSDFDNALDLSLAARVGEVIEAGISAFVSNTSGEVNLDVVTVVNALPVNAFSSRAAEASGTNGIPGWFRSDNIFGQLSGGFVYPIVAADIVDGMVTFRLRIRSGTAGAKTVHASATNPFAWWVQNLGLG